MKGEPGLDIKGEDGDPGPSGEPGPRGPWGEQGEAGAKVGGYFRSEMTLLKKNDRFPSLVIVDFEIFND